MAKLLNVSSSPHVRSSLTTNKIMYQVILSLMPVSILGVINYGMGALSVILAAVIAAVAAEAAFNAIIKKPQTIADGSAALTGLLLALVLPPNLPLYIPVLGSVFAIVVVKGMFGGLGKNFMNPALAARCFLLISYGSRMTTYKIDGVTTATPLVNIAAGQPVDLLELFIGHTSGIIGSSVLGILIGALILFACKVITYEIPVATIGSFAIFMVLFGGRGFDFIELLVHIMGGGILFGAIFMATDYVTSPVTPAGHLVLLSGFSAVSSVYAVRLQTLQVMLSFLQIFWFRSLKIIQFQWHMATEWRKKRNSFQFQNQQLHFVSLRW